MRRKFIHFGPYLRIAVLGCSSIYLFKSVIQLRSRIESQNGLEATTSVSDWSPIAPVDDITLHRSTGPNRTLKVLDLWLKDAQCSNFDVTLLEDNSTESIALVSYPGSGNSWLRMLLMAITGIYINSVYPGDSSFRSKANSTYRMAPNCGCTVLQKTHDFSLDGLLKKLPDNERTNELNRFKRKGVLIIRNPFKAIIAYKNFIAGGMKGVAPMSAFQGPAWNGFVARSAASWETLATVWIRGLERGGVVYYEDLRSDTQVQLIRLVKMIGIKTIDQQRLKCTIRHKDGNQFRRKNRPEYIKNPYLPGHRTIIRKAIANVQIALKERGLRPLPVDKYEYYDKP